MGAHLRETENEATNSSVPIAATASYRYFYGPSKGDTKLREKEWNLTGPLISRLARSLFARKYLTGRVLRRVLSFFGLHVLQLALLKPANSTKSCWPHIRNSLSVFAWVVEDALL